MSGGTVKRTAQAWVALRAEDPEAESAKAVAREHLDAARTLSHLRRFRVFELRGALPGEGALADLLHRSTQFYNPAKERCEVRRAPEDTLPISAREAVALVVERGGDRRPAAERWWKHETGAKVEVREGTAWVMEFEPETDVAERAAELAVAKEREAGLFANPHAQDVKVFVGVPGLDQWPGARQRREPERAVRRQP